jgi:uncharacterized protein (DUF58 family)
MRGWQAFLLVLVAGLVGLATGARAIEMAALALAVLLAIAVLYRTLLVGDVRSMRRVSDTVIAWGDPFVQKITLTNRARLSIPAIRVTDLSTLPDHPHGYVTSLRARRSVTWDVEIPCQQRGRYRLGPVEAHMSDPLGLFPVSRLVGAATSILVLPRWVPLSRCALRLDGFMPGEARGRRRGESPPSFHSVREYAVGDNISAIHWPASARSGQLMTKLFDPEIQTTLWLALDLDDDLPHDVEELVVTAATSLSVYGLQRANLRVGLVASGRTPVQLPSERGKPHQYRIQEVLAEARSGREVALEELLARVDRQFGPGQVFVLLTARGPDVWGATLNRLARKGVAARIIQVSDEPEGWSVPAVALSPAFADPANEFALIQRLEHGALSGGD